MVCENCCHLKRYHYLEYFNCSHVDNLHIPRRYEDNGITYYQWDMTALPQELSCRCENYKPFLPYENLLLLLDNKPKEIFCVRDVDLIWSHKAPYIVKSPHRDYK